MALDEYKRKRNFSRTPEPGPELEKQPGHRFVVQKHRATRLHYDFRLEMEGVLKSWAVPKGPSLDPADKRLAMMVEDHPVSYLLFEGIIPPDNYGAGTVMVWDAGTWEAEGDASEMLKKGDLKFRLYGQKLKGSFVLAHMKARRPGSKGNEWLLIKHRDESVVPGYDIDQYDFSVLTGRTLDQIAGDKGSSEWKSSRPATRGASSAKKDWLAESVARHDANERKKSSSEGGQDEKKLKRKATKTPTGSTATSAVTKAIKPFAIKGATSPAKSARKTAPRGTRPKTNQTLESDDSPGASPASPGLNELKGARKAPMPTIIHPMLATLVDQPFTDKDWLYEVKFDGYRALSFVSDGKARLLSRNQNDLTAQFPEVAELISRVRAQHVIIDGEVVALDEEGRASFSLMQQRTGIGQQGRRVGPVKHDVPIVYYAFDLLYLDGYDLRRVDLEQRKKLLSRVLPGDGTIHSSDDFPDGLALYEAAKQRGLEGIVAKRRRGCYLEKRSREWLKIKITQRQECVIGAYTDPKGSREHFGSIVLGLYDDQGRLVHVGQAGSGFSQSTHADMWRRLEKLKTDKSPFYGKVESLRNVHWVKPELVAEIKFTEWTHETEGGGVKMRAPVFEGLRFDKDPRECLFEKPKSARKIAEEAERGEAA